MPTAVEVAMHPQTGIPRAAASWVGRKVSGLSDMAIEDLSRLMFDQDNIEAVIAELERRGFSRQQIDRLVTQATQAGMALAPGVGLQVGGIMGEQ